jgi:heparosan-N-sulfate-glucuronate 5-epimerase
MKTAFFKIDFVMEENKKISLSLGDVSWNEELGNYYIDMRPAKIHYFDGTYKNKFDENGVPMMPNKTGYKYSPVNICQYGFILLADYKENSNHEILKCLNAIVDVLENLKSEDENYVIWWHDYYSERYAIEAPWASAMAQGEAISFYLRVYQITGDENLLKTARKAAQFTIDEKHPKRVAVRDENNCLWLEEYPSNPSSYVLNGFIYALYGLIDLYRIDKNETIKTAIDECFHTLNSNIAKFDAGYWSYYDLQIKELVRYYYQKNVHVLQLEVLYVLSENEIYKTYANKWRKQLTPLNYAFVQVMYRILPRWRKIFKNN